MYLVMQPPPRSRYRTFPAYPQSQVVWAQSQPERQRGPGPQMLLAGTRVPTCLAFFSPGRGRHTEATCDTPSKSFQTNFETKTYLHETIYKSNLSNKYLPTPYCVPDTILGTEVKARNKTHKNPCLHGTSFIGEDA